MNIYIEEIIIQNQLINFCLLKLIHSTTKNKTKFIKIFYSSLTGSIISILSNYFFDNYLLLILIYLINTISMIYLTFQTSRKQTIYNFILFILYSAAFRGIIVSTSAQIYYTSYNIITTYQFNMETICFTIIIATYIFDLVLRHLKAKIHTNNLLYELTIYKNNRKVKVNAYLDTGNFIQQNGQPVLILDLKTFLRLTNSSIIDFLSNKSRSISTSTVNGSNNLRLFHVDKISITQKNFKNEFNNQLVAISLIDCFKNTNYQALLSPLFL